MLCLCWLSVFLSLLGFDEAPPGEFTKRAFLNNKISLAEAEAVVDLIESHDRDGVLLSSKTLSGDFTDMVVSFSEMLLIVFESGLRVRLIFLTKVKDFLDPSLADELWSSC